MLRGTQIFATLSSSSILDENFYEKFNDKNKQSTKSNISKTLNPLQFHERNHALNSNVASTLPFTETLYSNLKETKISSKNEIVSPKQYSNSNTFNDSSDVFNVKIEAAKNIQQNDDKSIKSSSSNSKKSSSKKKSTLASEKRAQLDLINRSLIRFYDNNKNNDLIDRTSTYSTTSKASTSCIDDDEISKLIKESLSNTDNSVLINSLFSEHKLDRVLKSSHKIEFFQLIKAEIDSLKDSNELLQSKLNTIRFDLKSRDITVDDLKIKIAQLYVDLESAKLAKKNMETDKKLLINEIQLLSKDKQRYYSELVQVTRNKDQLQKSLDSIHLTLAEQGNYIEKLKSENQIHKQQVMDTRMKALKEKEELVKHLESIEADIISRERALHRNEYEKIMLEKVQLMSAEKEKYVKVIESLSYDLEQKTTVLNSLEQQLITYKSESSLFKNKYTTAQQESSNKTYENEKLKLKMNEVNTYLISYILVYLKRCPRPRVHTI